MKREKRRTKTTLVRRARGLVTSWHREDDPSQVLVSTVRTLYSEQHARYEDILFWLRMYGEDLTQTYGFSAVAQTGEDEPLPLNVTAAIIDTHVSKLARMRPRMVCTPVDGGFSAQKTATMRTKFVDGVWQETKFRAMARDSAADADVCGVGIIKGYLLDGRIVHDRCYAEDLIVDLEDARGGDPRSLYQTRWIDRGVAVELYPEFEEQIMAATSDPARTTADKGGADQILIYESWHLPDGRVESDAEPERGDETWEEYEARLREAKWGRHVVAIDGLTLRDEPWTMGRFPFVFFFSKPPRRGFWPNGMAERLYGYQCKIYDLVEMILDNVATHGNQRVYLQEGSHVLDSDLDDDVGGVVYYAGQKPTFGPTAIVAPEVYALLWQLVSRAYAQEGQSELQSHGEIPTGMAGASGTALRTITGISTGRDMVAGLNWDDAHQSMAELDLLLGKQASALDPSFAALYVGKQDGRWFAERLRFSDVDDGGEYVMRLESTADTPRTLAGKLAMFGDLEARGIPTAEETMAAVQLESVDRILELRTAPRRTVEWALEQIVEGRYISPEPFFPLETCLQLGLSYYSIAVQTGHESQELLIQWINDTEMLMESVAASAAPQAQAMPETTAPAPAAPVAMEGGMQ